LKFLNLIFKKNKMPRRISTLSFRNRIRIRGQLSTEDANMELCKTGSLPREDVKSESQETSQEAGVASGESSNSDSHEINEVSDSSNDQSQALNSEDGTSNSISSSNSNSLSINQQLQACRKNF
jgi:hypothetical protein